MTRQSKIPQVEILYAVTFFARVEEPQLRKPQYFKCRFLANVANVCSKGRLLFFFLKGDIVFYVVNFLSASEGDTVFVFQGSLLYKYPNKDILE